MAHLKKHKNSLKRFLLLNLGLLITAIGISLFKTPNHFAIGGTSGISIILASIFPAMNVGQAMFIINTTLVILGFIFLGKGFAGLTVYASFAISAYVAAVEYLIPLSAPFTNDTMLELVFATILPAVGSAIVFNVDASTGGTDIVAMIIKKHTSMEIGKALLVSDLLITVWAGAIFGIETGLYCVLGLFAKAFIVDSAIENINTRKYVTIVTSNMDEIKSFIIHDLKRSANISTVRGAYSGNEHGMITTVITRKQAVLLRNFMRETDPLAFITIVNSSETIGKGFRAI
ncbi:MAG: YitT family protein [Lachnospiraceae bacterium]